MASPLVPAPFTNSYLPKTNTSMVPGVNVGYPTPGPLTNSNTPAPISFPGISTTPGPAPISPGPIKAPALAPLVSPASQPTTMVLKPSPTTGVVAEPAKKETVQLAPQPQANAQPVAETPKQQTIVQAPAPKPIEAPVDSNAKTPTATETKTPPVDDNAWVKEQYKTAALSTDDEAGRRVFNNYINGIGLYNNAQRDALKMEVNQDPALRNQPAGTAIIAMLARDQNSTVNDTIGKMSIQSVQNIHDMNKWGIEGFQQAVQNEQTFKNNELQMSIQKLNAVNATRDYSAIQKATQAFVDSDPFLKTLGININTDNLKATDAATINSLDMTTKTIQDLITANQPDQAKSLYDQYRASHPELQLPDLTPEVFKVGAFQKSLATINSAEENIRTAALQKDDPKGLQAVKDYFTVANIDPVKYGQSLSLDQINTMRKSEGLQPWSQSDLIGQDMKQLAYDYKWYNTKSNSEVNTTKAITNLLLEDPGLKAAYMDPSRKTAIDSVSAELSRGGKITIDQSTGLPTVQAGTTYPWDDPKLEYMWKDWPIVDPSGNVTYKGGNFYNDVNDSTQDNLDPTTATGQYNTNLNRQYEQYLAKTPSESAVNRNAWFYGTKAGTIAYDANNVPKNVDITTPGKTPDATKVGEITYDSKSKNVSIEGTAKSIDKLNSVDWAKVTANQNALSSLIDGGAIKEVKTLPSDSRIGGNVQWLTDNGIPDTSYSTKDLGNVDGKPQSELTFKTGSQPIVTIDGKVYQLTRIKSSIYDDNAGWQTADYWRRGEVFAIDLSSGKSDEVAISTKNSDV